MVELDYQLSDIVYLITDSEQETRIVTSITITTSGVTYGLNCGVVYSEHYAFEIAKGEDIITKLGLN